MPVYKDEERNTWYVSFRYTDWRGERKIKKKRGFKLKREAEAYEREFKKKNKRSCDMTFASLVELYMNDAKYNLKDSTFDMKENIINTKILPYFGKRIVEEIAPADIKQWQIEIKKQKNKQGEPFKPTYLRTIHTQLNTIFNFAVKFYNLEKNPCVVSGPMGKKKAEEMPIWTVNEFNAAMEKVDSWSKRLAFQIMFWTGLRVSECLALKPKYILPSKIIKVKKNYCRKDGEDADSTLKTDNSYRKNPIPDFLYEEIQKYVHSLYGIENNDRIFYFTKGTLNKELTRAAQEAGISEIRVHDLRHSHAALLIELGYSMALVAERLGDTIETVMKTYAHLYPSKQEIVAERLNECQNGILPAPENRNYM